MSVSFSVSLYVFFFSPSHILFPSYLPLRPISSLSHILFILRIILYGSFSLRLLLYSFSLSSLFPPHLFFLFPLFFSCLPSLTFLPFPVSFLLASLLYRPVIFAQLGLSLPVPCLYLSSCFLSPRYPFFLSSSFSFPSPFCLFSFLLLSPSPFLTLSPSSLLFFSLSVPLLSPLCLFPPLPLPPSALTLTRSCKYRLSRFITRRPDSGVVEATRPRCWAGRSNLAPRRRHIGRP